jgi:hypothetical protein
MITFYPDPVDKQEAFLRYLIFGLLKQRCFSCTGCKEANEMGKSLWSLDKDSEVDDGGENTKHLRQDSQ